MSVFGIDFGNTTSVVAIARRGGVDICVNEVSRRETPTMVSFGAAERHIGEAGLTQAGRNIKNTVTQVKRLLGRAWDDEILQNDLKTLPYKVIKDEATGGCLCKVQYKGEELLMTPTQVTAVILGNLRDIAEKENGAKITDVVIAVPSYYNDQQRRAMLDAAEISGLNVLRLTNETTAAGLQYGIPKSNDFDEEKPSNVMIFDLGHASLNVAVIAYLKGKMTVVAQSSLPDVGGRNLDQVLVDYFCELFADKYKIDIKSRPRALLRLTTSCEKVKKVLSANPEAPLNIECLMDDIDVSGMITREKFEELAAPFLTRVLDPVKACLEEAGLEPADVKLELCGGAVRVPSIQKALHTFFDAEPSKTLNLSEAIAKGCAFMGAMISPAYFVRSYAVNDMVPYPITVSWEPTGEAGEDEPFVEIYKRGDVYPKSRMLSFRRKDAFELKAAYSDSAKALLPSATVMDLGKFNVSNLPADAGDEDSLIKVKVRVNLNGIFTVEDAHQVKEIESDEPEAMETDEAAKDEGEAKEGEAKEGEAKEGEDAPEPKKKKVKRVELTVADETTSMTRSDINTAIELEGNMAAQDRIVKETLEAKNNVESYVYDMRSRITGDLAKFTEPQVAEEWTKQLNETEDWLYGEGEDAKKSVYVEKLKELSVIGEPILARYTEARDRPEAADYLRQTIATWKSTAKSTDEKFSHIEQGDRDTILAECDKQNDWLNDKLIILDSAPQHLPAKTTCVEIRARAETLTKFARPIMYKAKPKPVVEEEKKDEPEAAKEEEKAEEKADPKMDIELD